MSYDVKEITVHRLYDFEDLYKDFGEFEFRRFFYFDCFYDMVGYKFCRKCDDNIKICVNINLQKSCEIDIQQYENLRFGLVNCDKRFYLAGVLIKYIQDDLISAHSNCLIFDKVEETIEHFDPHGYETSIYNYCYPEMVNKFSELIGDLFPNYRYIEPIQITDKFNVQLIFEDHVLQKNLCSLWIWWYAYMRLQNPEMDSKKLIAEALAYNQADKYQEIQQFVNTFCDWAIYLPEGQGPCFEKAYEYFNNNDSSISLEEALRDC